MSCMSRCFSAWQRGYTVQKIRFRSARHEVAAHESARNEAVQLVSEEEAEKRIKSLVLTFITSIMSTIDIIIIVYDTYTFCCCHY